MFTSEIASQPASTSPGIWQRCRQRLTSRSAWWSAFWYVVPLLLVGWVCWLLNKYPQFIPENKALVIFYGLAGMYLLGGIIFYLLRCGFRMFALPIIFMSALLVMLILEIATPPVGKNVVLQIWEMVQNHPYVLFIIPLLMWRPQIAGLLRRIQKAEIPGGAKFELDKLDELQRTLNPWRKTVSRFADLMQLVSELIEETPEEDVIRFLAYTPALGFLTRTESEWTRLHRLLIGKPNIQIICLEKEDLKGWHNKFKDKRTARPGGKITREMIERANRISEGIIAEKRIQIDSRVRPVEKKWCDLPGYYLFANSKRAIIAAPLFLPNDPGKENSKVQPDNNIANTPVKMLGFESNDNWTVWLVNEVCDQYAKADFRVQPSD